MGPAEFCQKGCGQIKSECECPSKCDVCGGGNKSRHKPGCEEAAVKAKEAKFLSKKLAKNKKSIKKSQKKSKSKRKQRKVRSAKKL
jgi:hypothetical protein